MESEVIWLSPPRVQESLALNYRFQRKLVDINLDIQVLVRGGNLQVQAKANASAFAWKKLRWEAESFRRPGKVEFNWTDNKDRKFESEFSDRMQIGISERDVLAPSEILLSSAEAYNPNFIWYAAPYEIPNGEGVVIFKNLGGGRLLAKSFSMKSQDGSVDQFLEEEGVFGAFEKGTDMSLELTVAGEHIDSIGFKIPVVGHILLERTGRAPSR